MRRMIGFVTLVLGAILSVPPASLIILLPPIRRKQAHYQAGLRDQGRVDESRRVVLHRT